MRNPNFEWNGFLRAGVLLSAINLLLSHSLDISQQAPFSFAQGLIEGASIGLLMLGLFQCTPGGKTLLARFRTWKLSLWGEEDPNC